MNVCFKGDENPIHIAGLHLPRNKNLAIFLIVCYMSFLF